MLPYTSAVEHLLDFIDQGSFLGLRATGREPMIQITWIIAGTVDESALRRFDDALGHTTLGRRVERSSVPAGRHHWVRSSEPGDLHLVADAVDPGALAEWTASLVLRPIDPEVGPGRSLAARPLADGTTAVVLTVSHTLADLGTVLGAVRDAVLDRRHELDLPPPRRAVTWRVRAHDARVAVRSLPAAARSARAVVRLARAPRERPRTPRAPLRRERGARTEPTPTVEGLDAESAGAVIAMPTACAFGDEQEWEARARALGGTGNTLRLALTAHAAAAIGRVDPEGQVALSIPMSDRVAGDSRANAVVPLALRVDPDGITEDLGGLRAAFSEARALVRSAGDVSANPMDTLALVPFIPRGVARRLEAALWNSGSAVYFTHIGQLDAAILRPFGVEAIAMFLGGNEAVPAAYRTRSGSALAVLSWVVGGQVGFGLGGWKPGGVEDAAQLRALVRGVLDDFGLTGEVR